MQLNSLLGKIKADFQTEFFASLLQSHNPSEILLTILFSTKKHLLLLLSSLLLLLLLMLKRAENIFFRFFRGDKLKEQHCLLHLLQLHLLVHLYYLHQAFEWYSSVYCY